MPFGNRAALDAGRGGKYEVSQDCVLVLEGSRMGLEAVVVQEGGGSGRRRSLALRRGSSGTQSAVTLMQRQMGRPPAD